MMGLWRCTAAQNHETANWLWNGCVAHEAWHQSNYGAVMDLGNASAVQDLATANCGLWCKCIAYAIKASAVR